MNLDDYQKAAARTSGKHRLPDRQARLNCATGLVGEAGEVAEHVKKYRWHGKRLEVRQLRNELGDVCWYLAEACTLVGLRLQLAAGTRPAGAQEDYCHVQLATSCAALAQSVAADYVHGVEANAYVVWSAILRCCDVYGLDPFDVLQANVAKLKARYPEEDA